MCWLCQASSTLPDLLFSNFSPDAGWRGTRWSHEAYLDYLRAAALTVPVLLTAIIGFRLECVMVDTLHAVDQGVACHIIANVIWLLVFMRNCLGGRNHEERAKRVNEHLAEWYRVSGKPGASKIQGGAHNRASADQRWLTQAPCESSSN